MLPADRVTGLPTGITRANWRTHPHSIWAFQNLQAFLPTAEVPAGAFVRRLEPGAIDLSGLRFQTPEGDAIGWPDFLERTHADALLVLHRGRIVFEHYANGMAPASRHMLFSVTKSVVGLLAEMLIDDGLLDEAATPSKYVPELAGSAFGRATMRSLLDMTDGVAFDEDYANPDADIHVYSAHYWGGAEGGVRAALPRLGTPGAPGRFAYRTPVSDVIGWCLARASEQSLAALMSERLWRPIGAERPAFLVRDTGGQEISAAGLNATLRDVGRLALLLLDGGRVGDRQVVAPALIDRLLSGGDRVAFAAAMPTRPDWSYRSQWWIPSRPGTLCALGVFGQRVLIDIPEQLAIVRFGSHPVASNVETDAIHEAAFAALRTHLSSVRP